MRRWKVVHRARKMGAIGRFYWQSWECRADNERRALEKHRRYLWDRDFETAGGTASPITYRERE
jgi:hypothetical protein